MSYSIVTTYYKALLLYHENRNIDTWYIEATHTMNNKLIYQFIFPLELFGIISDYDKESTVEINNKKGRYLDTFLLKNIF